MDVSQNQCQGGTMENALAQGAAQKQSSFYYISDKYHNLNCHQELTHILDKVFHA